MKGRFNVGTAFIGGFASGFAVCLFSVFVLSPLMSLETLSGAGGQSTGNAELIQAGSISPLTESRHSLSSTSPCHDWVSPSPLQKDDPWNTMKAVNRPAPCPVNGFAIEELDPANNFRRLYSLGFTANTEDKMGVLPYMLAAQDLTMQTKPRRVYLDLGGNRFNTSVTWFSHFYPLDFTEYHIFEIAKDLFHIPPHHSDKAEQLQAMDGMSVRAPGQTPLPIPNHILDRMQVYRKLVGAADGEGQVNITRFIKEELGIKPDDVLIVKMDIEQWEWPILAAWLEDAEMPKLVDELFVEVHYNHKSMKNFGWMKMKHAREEATNLFVDLRKVGFYCHPWP